MTGRVYQKDISINQFKFMKNKLLKTIIMLSKRFLYGFILQTILLNFVLAVDVNGQYKKIEEVKITLSNNELTLLQFFSEVQVQTPFKFSYENQQLDKQMALNFSKKKKIKTIGFSGFDGGYLKKKLYSIHSFKCWKLRNF